MAEIDHLMWAVPDLADGVDRLESLTGARAAAGGAHPGMGTANALLGLGPGVYLEVIGPDPALDEPTGFGAILATLGGPELRTWAIRTDDINDACRALTAAGFPAEPRAITRTTPDGATLAWHVAMVPGRPIGDRWPFLIDWGTSRHPAESAPKGGTLDTLTVVDPDAAQLTRVLRAVSCEVEVSPGEAALTALLRTAVGPVEL
jgi:Glyoxalase-like domain